MQSTKQCLAFINPLFCPFKRLTKMSYICNFQVQTAHILFTKSLFSVHNSWKTVISQEHIIIRIFSQSFLGENGLCSSYLYSVFQTVRRLCRPAFPTLVGLDYNSNYPWLYLWIILIYFDGLLPSQWHIPDVFEWWFPEWKRLKLVKRASCRFAKY